VEIVVLTHRVDSGRQFAQWFVILRLVDGEWMVKHLTYGAVT
jgi:hypothetical protein